MSFREKYNKNTAFLNCSLPLPSWTLFKVHFFDIGPNYSLTEKHQVLLWLTFMKFVVSGCDRPSYSGILDLDNQKGIVCHSTAKWLVQHFSTDSVHASVSHRVTQTFTGLCHHPLSEIGISSLLWCTQYLLFFIHSPS